jgi:hypothetical protein
MCIWAPTTYEHIDKRCEHAGGCLLFSNVYFIGIFSRSGGSGGSQRPRLPKEDYERCVRLNLCFVCKGERHPGSRCPGLNSVQVGRDSKPPGKPSNAYAGESESEVDGEPVTVNRAIAAMMKEELGLPEYGLISFNARPLCDDEAHSEDGPYNMPELKLCSEFEAKESEPDDNGGSDGSMPEPKSCAELEVTEPEPDDDDESGDSMPELIEVSDSESDGAFDNDGEMDNPKWSPGRCFQCHLRQHDGSGSHTWSVMTVEIRAKMVRSSPYVHGHENDTERTSQSHWWPY